MVCFGLRVFCCVNNLWRKYFFFLSVFKAHHIRHGRENLVIEHILKQPSAYSVESVISACL